MVGYARGVDLGPDWRNFHKFHNMAYIAAVEVSLIVAERSIWKKEVVLLSAPHT